ncbi:MAG: pyridoxamine 5-phosphate oxidase-like protein [Frankiales bacterium]|nr:pyridoxamine 5-phosphate oxidase-like protein [Frankiales bacterium]
MQDLEHFRRTKNMLLSTRRRDGSWVPTPVSVVVDEHGMAYFRTWSTAGKAKRLRNFPDVRVAPCTAFGRPTGSDQPGIARLLDGTESTRARDLLSAKYPVMHRVLVPLVHRLRGQQTQHYQLRPTDEPTGEQP